MFVNPFLNFCDRIVKWVIWFGEHLQSLFLLIIRLTWGHQFFMAGYSKLVHREEVIQYFNAMHFSHPALHTYLVSSIELVGGLLLFIGFASRLAAVPLAITMLGSLITYHAFQNLHFIENPAFLVHSTSFPFLMAAAIILLFGPGRISIDAWIKRISRHWHQF